MKLGTETNSLVNHLMSRAVIGQPEPAVGMGVTFLHWTDRSAGTIVDVVVKNGKIVIFGAKEDKATRVDKNGMSEDQTYVYERDDGARLLRYKLDRKGVWRGVSLNADGRWVFNGGPGVQLGVRNAYHDFSF
jgi:hypothetical protein